MNKPPLRIVVADDHPLFREGLVATINSLESATVVAEASNGREAIKAVEKTSPNVVVIDLHMPEMNGIEATRTISQQWPDVAILVLTMLEDDDSVFAAIDAGARGYILKEADRAQILRALESVAAGEAVFGQSIAPRVISSVTKAGLAPPFRDLTEREREILELLATGLTNPAIAGRLYLSEKTVRNYVSSIFAKLHVTDRAAAVAKARDAGLGKSARG